VKPRVSIVVPVYNEGDAVTRFLDRLLDATGLPSEVLVVYDFAEDTTAPPLAEYAARDPRVVPTLNTYGRGPANAIRFGIDHATADVVVVTMADGSDDPRDIQPLTELVEQGAVVGAASRYSKGGRQNGGPLIKRTMSRMAGLSLALLARVGTYDATNNFKAYSRRFIEEVGIDSEKGFEIALELVAKARRLRLPVAEIPTVWTDRAEGASNFRLVNWLPLYLRWYFFAFGPRLDLAKLKQRTRTAA
jgi:glycosyltransferase involved in cell wall biosynthesis